MDDPTDYYLGISIVVLLTCSLIGILCNILRSTNEDGFDESYIEAENDIV
jgi:hypothetical protein